MASAPPGRRLRRGAALRRRLWRRIASSSEGKVLFAGVVFTLAYLACVGATALWSSGLFHKLWTMTGTHILFGRAAGMTWGYHRDLPPWLVIVVNMAIETFVVLLVYPLFVFSYRRLLVIKPLEDFMSRARQAAEAHRRTIVKFGVPGLFIFVWVPFWMTGPVVGSIIGFLIGLPMLVNLLTVLGGTYVAILCWGLVLHRVYERLERLGPYFAGAFVVLVLVAAVAIHVWLARSKSPTKAARDAAKAADTEGEGRAAP
jgi:uncharacterized membrane protein